MNAASKEGKTAHTPGPWHAGGRQVEADDGSLICSLSGWKGDGVSKANALLIAAAPETAQQRDNLLKALEKIEYALRKAEERCDSARQIAVEALSRAKSAPEKEG